jgi:hypothetical protein
MVDLQLQLLRLLVKDNFAGIIDFIIDNHIKREDNEAVKSNGNEICMFCSSNQNLTKEHVIPRWAFDKSTQKYFITDVNGLSQTYNKTTIPACATCNSNLLNALEKYINQLFLRIDLELTFFTSEELGNIIRWLEIIDYKFQILNIKRKFVTSKEGGYIPYLADFPISMLRLNQNYAPRRVVSEIKRSLKRITVKNKTKSINSLVVFKTSNPDFHFFHTMDDFIFIEFPKHKIAVFYFYNKLFDDVKIAHDEAMEIINKVC